MSAAASFELLMLEYNSLKHVNNAAFEEYQTWRESRRNYKNTRLSGAQTDCMYIRFRPKSKQ